MKALNDDHKRLFDLIWSLCRRPNLFTINGTSDEIWAFINGAESIFYNSVQNDSPLSDFGYWLETRFEINGGKFWIYCLKENPQFFGSISKDDIWNIFADFYLQQYGIIYKPIEFLPCGYSG